MKLLQYIPFFLFLCVGLVSTFEDVPYGIYDDETDRRTLGRRQYAKYSYENEDDGGYDDDDDDGECTGSWSEWRPITGSVCSALCGSCGVIESERTCKPAGCKCKGKQRGFQDCNFHPCYRKTYTGCD